MFCNLWRLLISPPSQGIIVVVQLLHCVWLFATPWTTAHLKLMLSWLYHPTILSSVVPFSSRLRSFPASGSFPMNWLYISTGQSWSFSLNISPSNEYSGLISFRVDWLDLLAVQGTLKSLIQHHSSKSISSLVLSFLYSPTLISTHGYWKNHSFD